MQLGDLQTCVYENCGIKVKHLKQVLKLNLIHHTILKSLLTRRYFNKLSQQYDFKIC